MKASDLFPEQEERQQVRHICKMFNGRVTRVEVDGEVMYDNDSFKQTT